MSERASHQTSWLANQRATKETLERFGLATKYRLGQNFLVQDHVIEKIVQLAEVQPTDVVVEVGPGLGTLTVALLDRACAVCSLEADSELEQVLAVTCKEPHPDSFALVMGDALAITPQKLAEAYSTLSAVAQDVAQSALMPTKFVSNLPYQVAATLILKFFQELPSLERAVVMVQAEVADRIAAKPSTKVYGAYTAKLSLFAQVYRRQGALSAKPHKPPETWFYAHLARSIAKQATIERRQLYRLSTPPKFLGLSSLPVWRLQSADMLHEQCL